MPVKMILTAVAIVAAFATPTASAATLTYDGGPLVRPYPRWGAKAKVPLPPAITLTMFDDGRCGLDKPACAYPPATIAIRSDEQYMLRDTYYHELGHLFDYQVMTDYYRSEFMRTMGLTGEWRQPSSSPHEQFAEGYALCALRYRLPWAGEMMGYGYSPDSLQHARVCLIIRFAMVWHRLHGS